MASSSTRGQQQHVRGAKVVVQASRVNAATAAPARPVTSPTPCILCRIVCIGLHSFLLQHAHK
jgi:hypothetical protein